MASDPNPNPLVPGISITTARTPDTVTASLSPPTSSARPVVSQIAHPIRVSSSSGGLLNNRLPPPSLSFDGAKAAMEIFGQRRKQSLQLQHKLQKHPSPQPVPVKDLGYSNVPSPQPKVSSSSSSALAVPESNGHKDTREKASDESLTVIRNRKIRLIEERSFYALCRSWLRDGFQEESQPQYGSTARSLPKPTPITIATEDIQMKCEENGREEDEEQEEQGSDDAELEDGELIKTISTEDLFKRHIKRAKKVRARLREVRLKRIARYKSRLALLLPPLVEQMRNDASAT